MQHIDCNFKKLHRGKALQDLLWKIERASNIHLNNATLNELEEYNIIAYDLVKKGSDPTHWCRAYFDSFTRSDTLCNNLSVSFNTYILKSRDNP